MSSSLDADIARLLDERRRVGLLRRREVWTSTGPITVRDESGREYVNFASNNYLGLTHHPRVIAALRGTAAGSGAAGLISGHTDAHAAAERAIAAWKSCGAAILLPSGYQANLAVVQTLAALGGTGTQTVANPTLERSAGMTNSDGSGGVRFLIDKLAHASLLDAVRLTGAEFRVFPHNGMAKLRRLLEASPPGQRQVVLTESIFSMDGDAADLAGLVEMKREFDFTLVVDEAHGSGVYGRGGAGLIDEAGVRADVDVTVVTLSKALGSSGAAVCGSAAFIAALVNFGRAYIYSTAVPPQAARVIEAAVGVCLEEPQHQQRVRSLATQVRSMLNRAGIAVGTGESPVVPLMLGDAGRAMSAAAALRETGLLVVAVRPPTVPPGRSRLRVTLSASHTDSQIDRLLRTLIAMHANGRLRSGDAP